MQTRLLRLMPIATALLTTSHTFATELEPVIVTAQRRAEPIQDVPVSIAAFDTETIVRMGMDDFFDYGRMVPGLAFFDRGPGDKDFFIRGISTLVGNPLTQVYIDDVPQTASNAGAVQIRDADPRLFDIERIEVLRGPQATLFGASAMGGTIRILTNRPDPTRFSGSGDVTVSTTRDGGESLGVNAMVNIPLIEGKLALRTVAMYRDSAGWVDILPKGDLPGSGGIPNPGGGLFDLGRPDQNQEDVRGARAALQYTPNDKLTVLGSVYWQEVDLADRSLIDGAFADREYVRQSTILEPRQDHFTQSNLTIEYDFGSAMLVSSTSYIDREVNERTDLGFLLAGLVDLPIITDRHNPFETLSQELRLSSNRDGRFNYTIGAFYLDMDGGEDQTAISPGFTDATGIPTPNDLLFDKNIYSFEEQMSVFGQVDWEVLDGLRIEAGARYFDYELGFDNFQDGFFNGDVVTTDTRSIDEDGWAPRVAVSYRMSEDDMVFASASEGFRTGTTHPFLPDTCDDDLAELGFDGAPTLIDSDSLWQYEIGAKTGWMNNRMTINGTLYYIDWEDIPQFVQLFGCGFQLTTNVGKASSTGFELEMQARPTDRVDLSLTVGHTDAQLEEDAPFVGGSKGDRLQNIPKWTTSASAQYSFPIGANHSGYVRGDYSYISDSYDSYDFDNPSQRRPSYSLVNLRVGVASDDWEVILFADNLFDEFSVVGLRQFNNQLYVGRPLTVGLTFRKYWDGGAL